MPDNDRPPAGRRAEDSRQGVPYSAPRRLPDNAAPHRRDRQRLAGGRPPEPYNLASGDARDDPGEIDAPVPPQMPPVPANPVHLCPSCRYNLTGLTHRRCPECGEEFELKAARMAGAGGIGLLDRSDLWALRTARAQTVTGFALILLSYAAPLYYASDRRGFTTIFILLLACPVMLWLFVRHSLDLDWPAFILGTGLIALLLGIISLAFYVL